MSTTCVGYAQALGSHARRRSPRLDWRLGVVLLGAAATAPAQRGHDAAARGLAVSSTLEQLGAAVAAGEGEQVVAAATSTPSNMDQVIMSVAFTNTTAQVVDAVRITSAIPADVRYVAGSATGPGSQALFSVDQGRTFGRPGELTVVDADGAARAAEAADYTHVRWVLDGPLDAGATGVARFRAVPR